MFVLELFLEQFVQPQCVSCARAAVLQPDIERRAVR